MKTFSCQCGNRLYFENTICVSCGGEVGWCPTCRNIRLLQPSGSGNGSYTCAIPGCNSQLVKCYNYQTHGK